jgi:hypothetical protein
MVNVVLRVVNVGIFRSRIASGLKQPRREEVEGIVLLRGLNVLRGIPEVGVANGFCEVGDDRRGVSVTTSAFFVRL